MYVSSRQGYKPPVKSTGKVKEYTHFASLKYCNGAETFYTYDPQRRILQNLTVNSGGNTIMDNAYTYDAVSNVLSVINGASVPQSGKAGGDGAYLYIRCSLPSCQRNWYIYWCRQQDCRLHPCNGLRQHAIKKVFFCIRIK